MTKSLFIPGNMPKDFLRACYYQHQPICVSDDVRQKIELSRSFLQEQIAAGEIIYGVNTGFGKLANKVIPRKDLLSLQQELLHSHAAGVGEPLQPEIVRLILLLKLSSLAQGYSGVSWELTEQLLAFYNGQGYPLIPEQGSVGASGDLAPLAHLGLALAGEGEVFYQDQLMSASTFLTSINSEPYCFQEKEALAIINGTQVSTALALAALFTVENLLDKAIAIGALATVVAGGRLDSFSNLIQMVRGFSGQKQVAKLLREHLSSQKYPVSSRVQDPYCLRCQPQVVGSLWEQVQHCAKSLLQEANGVTDNPLIFVAEQQILSGGNFHGEPIALAADLLAICIAELGNISERRIAMLLDPEFTGLTPFLAKDPGHDSGLMAAHVTAAALASENKVLAHPAAVDTIPTSGNQEDHVSMATFASRRLHLMLRNLSYILGVELLAVREGVQLNSAIMLKGELRDLFEQSLVYKKEINLGQQIHCLGNWLARGM